MVRNLLYFPTEKARGKSQQDQPVIIDCGVSKVFVLVFEKFVKL